MMTEEVVQKKVTKPAEIEQLFKGKEVEEVTRESKKQVFKKEANEFLKFIKQNEYNVVEQLNKMSARISLLSLLLNSEPPRCSHEGVKRGIYGAQ